MAYGIQRQHVRFDGIRLVQDNGSCDHVLQLTDVSWPTVSAHGLHGCGTEHHAWTLRIPGMPVQKKLGESREIIEPLAKRGQREADDRLLYTSPSPRDS